MGGGLAQVQVARGRAEVEGGAPVEVGHGVDLVARVDNAGIIIIIMIIIILVVVVVW